MLSLQNADFFEAAKDLKDGSVSLIFADIPYNVTMAEWDKKVWDLPTMWAIFNRVLKPNGAVIMTATEPFNVDLINSNRKDFRYSWVWEKNLASGFLNAKKMPLKAHELVLVWYRKLPIYSPQFTEGKPYGWRTLPQSFSVLYGEKKGAVCMSKGGRYPKSVLHIKGVRNDISKSQGRQRHPTEKPVELLEYMIKTYTNEGDLVLDPCMGTGATMVAAQNLNRKGIGIELDPGYFATALQRLEK